MKTPKTKTKLISEKLDIRTEMRAFDNKDRNFFNDLTVDEKRKFSNYMMIRWGAAVMGSHDLQAYYILATNENLNKNFFSLNKHPQLQWLCATTVSPNLGPVYHYWQGSNTKKSTVLKKKIIELLPNAKLDDIETFMSVNTEEQLVQWLVDHGYDGTE